MQSEKRVHSAGRERWPTRHTIFWWLCRHQKGIFGTVNREWLDDVVEANTGVYDGTASLFGWWLLRLGNVKGRYFFICVPSSTSAGVWSCNMNRVIICTNTNAHECTKRTQTQIVYSKQTLSFKNEVLGTTWKQNSYFCYWIYLVYIAIHAYSWGKLSL